jgi:hypothetical protein
MRWTTVMGAALSAVFVVLSGQPGLPSLAYGAEAPVALGSAGTYSVLGGTAVTNTGNTSATGDIGVSPAASIVGFPPGITGGVIHSGDAEAAQARADLELAYNDAAGRTPGGTFAGDLNGHTFDPGVYATAGAMALTGTLTLDGQGDPSAVFIFQVGAALNTAAGSAINLINGASAANVFWQVLGAAGTGATSSFAGTIMAFGAITLGADSTLTGQALSYGTVTLATNTITTAIPLPAGSLSISVPRGVDIGTSPETVGGETITGQLGVIRVDDTRDAGAGWVVTVTATALTAPNNAPIAVGAIRYSVGPILGVGAIDTDDHPGDLTDGPSAVTASVATGNNSASWSPTIAVTVPGATASGVYTSTITHSVM